MRRLAIALALLATFALSACGPSSSTSKRSKPVHRGVAVKGPIQRYYVHGPEVTKLAAPPVAPTRKSSATLRPPVPAQPSASTGGPYRLVYADAFGAPIGSGAGQDSGWKANNHTLGCCNNSDERATELESMVRTSAAGLEVNCVHESNNGFAFTCGGTDTETPNGFKLKYGSGITFAVQVRMKWPLASECGQDPGAWISGPKWTVELDLAEGWGWNPKCVYSGGVPVFIYQTPSSSIRLQCVPWEGCDAWVPHPDTEEHTYTTVIEGTTGFTEYIDGKNRGHVTGANANTSEYVHLIFTHALREASGSTPPHLNGTSVFHVSYVAVYENGSGNTEHGSPSSPNVAPGTTVEGSTPPPPTTETTPPPPPPPPTTTETTPTPPPAEGPPPAPIELTAKWNGSATAPSITVSAPAVPGATGYYLYRAGPNSYGEPGAPWGPSHTTPSFSNGGAVKYGDRECYWLAAFNSHGTGPLSREVCARAHG